MTQDIANTLYEMDNLVVLRGMNSYKAISVICYSIGDIFYLNVSCRLDWSIALSYSLTIFIHHSDSLSRE